MLIQNKYVRGEHAVSLPQYLSGGQPYADK
nr:MAG TPA: hypothetical protein [Caudoviricetes sp.]